jgi:hypothetical protein
LCIPAQFWDSLSFLRVWTFQAADTPESRSSAHSLKASVRTSVACGPGYSSSFAPSVLSGIALAVERSKQIHPERYPDRQRLRRRQGLESSVESQQQEGTSDGHLINLPPEENPLLTHHWPFGLAAGHWGPAQPGAGAQELSQQGANTTITGTVVDEQAKPQAGALIRCSGFGDSLANGMLSPTVTLGEAASNEAGQFTLPIPPGAPEQVRCWVGGGAVYEIDEKIIPIGRDAQVIFTLKFVTIPQLEGWVHVPPDWDLRKILVLVRQSNDVIRSERPDPQDGRVMFTDVKAGPAEVTYSYDGLGLGSVQRFLMPGSDISPTLRFASFPSALILLIPGVGVLGVLAYMSLRWRQDPDRQRQVGDPALMLASLVLWGATFAVLWFLLKSREGSGLHFFRPTLSFSLSVPIFGFIGAMLFVIDFLRTGTGGAPDYREFALRVALGPYVAIVMVLLLGGTFQITGVTQLVSDALGLVVHKQNLGN